jgi:hypothetical protein
MVVNRRLHGLQQLPAISPERRRQLLASRCRFGRVIVLDASAIVLEPCRRRLGPQPVRGYDGETVEGVTESLADEFQPVEDPNGCQHVRRVGALAPTGLEQPGGT